MISTGELENCVVLSYPLQLDDQATIVNWNMHENNQIDGQRDIDKQPILILTCVQKFF